MKLHIFGASGSGVTTLGKTLSSQLNIPYLDSDEYFWEKSDNPFTIRRDPDERNALTKKDIDHYHSWIFGGSVIDWGGQLFPSFDLIVFLWIPAEIRIERLKKRELERYGEILFSNPDRHRQFEKFLTWAADYDTDTGIANRTLSAHKKWLKKNNCPVLEIRGDKTVDERIHIILQKLNESNLQ